MYVYIYIYTYMYTFYCLLPRSGKIFTIFMLKSALECTKMNVFMHFSEKQSKKFRLYRTNESKIFVCTRAKSFVLYKKTVTHSRNFLYSAVCTVQTYFTNDLKCPNWCLAYSTCEFRMYIRIKI